MTFDEIADNFAFLDDWEDRYRYLIDLGRELAPLKDEERAPANKVRGCASQVWLVTEPHGDKLAFRGDSDAHIVRGLIAALIALYSDKAPADILKTDEKAAFTRLGLTDHLTPQRSNGLASMVARIKSDAAAAMQTEQRAG